MPRKLGLLLERTNGGTLLEAHDTVIGRLLPHDDLEEGGLAGAVGAHERPALTGIELQRGALVEGPPTKGLGYLVCEENHGRDS